MRQDGRFGEYGGFYVSELLIPILEEVEAAWLDAREDAEFIERLDHLLRTYAGRPTPLYRSQSLTDACGCPVYLKREDLVHGGAHKTNNTIAQALLAERMGKTRLIAETGAGQHGVATAMAGALFGLEVDIFMGAKDVARQQPNVKRMELFGAKVHPVEAGSRSLKDAINETMRYWTETVQESFYVFGTVAGPHPFPAMVKDFQRVIGHEAREQIIRAEGRLPSRVIACVGGGSNAMGIFADFVDDGEVALIGVEPAGEGIETGRHGAPLGHGSPGCLHGSISYVLQDRDGQIHEAHSISAGLDYPGVGPEHAHLLDSGRATYVSVTDAEALDAFQWLCRNEGILPALESSHAIAHVLRQSWYDDDLIIINLSGRGDKDLDHVIGEMERRRAAPAVSAPPAGSADAIRASERGETPTAPEPPRATNRPDRLSAVFSALASRGEAAFMPFLVLGDPTPDTSVALANALVTAGADLLEFGFAFSDPPADGPVIQAADLRALRAGMTTAKGFEVLQRVRDTHPDVPFALLVYANIVLQFGVEAFYARCAQVGVDAVLVADVPLESSDELLAAADMFGVAPVFIASELSHDDRLAKIGKLCRGYLYAVARVGTTGERSEVSHELAASIARFRQHTDVPILAGFGISTPAHVRRVVEAGADGVICGSAIVRRIEANLDDGPKMLREVATLAAEMKLATRRG